MVVGHVHGVRRGMKKRRRWWGTSKLDESVWNRCGRAVQKGVVDASTKETLHTPHANMHNRTRAILFLGMKIPDCSTIQEHAPSPTMYEAFVHAFATHVAWLDTCRFIRHVNRF